MLVLDDTVLGCSRSPPQAILSRWQNHLSLKFCLLPHTPCFWQVDSLPWLHHSLPCFLAFVHPILTIMYFLPSALQDKFQVILLEPVQWSLPFWSFSRSLPPLVFGPHLNFRTIAIFSCFSPSTISQTPFHFSISKTKHVGIFHNHRGNLEKLAMHEGPYQATFKSSLHDSL